MLNGRVVDNAETPTFPDSRIVVDGQDLAAAQRVYWMLNKPRGLVTTAQDEHGRDTIYRCLEGLDLPWLAPVGRLDKASEGLLLLSNDPKWASELTSPESQLNKTYDVQVDRIPGSTLLTALTAGVLDQGERLAAVNAQLLRAGERTAWLQITLNEGRNRQIRRMLAAFELEVLRLVRVAIGDLQLGALAKGKARALTELEVASLRLR